VQGRWDPSDGSVPFLLRQSHFSCGKRIDGSMPLLPEGGKENSPGWSPPRRTQPWEGSRHKAPSPRAGAKPANSARSAECPSRDQPTTRVPDPFRAHCEKGGKPQTLDPPDDCRFESRTDPPGASAPYQPALQINTIQARRMILCPDSVNSFPAAVAPVQTVRHVPGFLPPPLPNFRPIRMTIIGLSLKLSISTCPNKGLASPESSENKSRTALCLCFYRSPLDRRDLFRVQAQRSCKCLRMLSGALSVY